MDETDEKIKTWTRRFPAKENMEKALLQYDVTAKYRLISRKFSGMKFFHPSVRLTNQKPRAFVSSFRWTNQIALFPFVCCVCFVRAFLFQGHTKIVLLPEWPVAWYQCESVLIIQSTKVCYFVKFEINYNNGSAILFFTTGRKVHGPEHRLIMICLLRDWCDRDFPGEKRLLSKQIVDNLPCLFFVVCKAAWKLNRH